MRVQKLTGRQWTSIIVLSYCGAIGLSMRFAMPNLSEAQQINALTEIVWNLRNSLSGTSVNSTLLFGGLVGLGVLVLVYRMREAARPPRALLPVSFLIALVWLMGAGFRINNTLESLDTSPGQIVKSVLYVVGSTYLIYELGQLLFCFLEKQGDEVLSGQGKLAQMYQNHPFGVSFFAVLLFWLPHLIIAYPGYMCVDAWNQLSQFFGKRTFTAQHAPGHTIFMGFFTQIGVRMGNGNIGLYISIVVQFMVAVLVLSYALSLMKEWKSPRWLRIMTYAVIILVPYYINYAVMAIKDTLFSICFLLFAVELICMLQKGIDYFTDRKHILLFAASVVGTVLSRNNGAYVLYPTIFVLVAYFFATERKSEKKNYIKPAICLLAPVLAANLLYAAAVGYYGVEKTPIREMLSLPFQQTARYVRERGDEVTDEEAEAIRAVLDYDSLAEKYNPVLSDPVKFRANSEVTMKELQRYIVVWFKMFFKHPEIYIKATMNQNYFLLYPFTESCTIYTYTTLESAHYYIDLVNDELGISEVETLNNPKNTLRGLQYNFFSLPVIGLFSHPAPYCISLIFFIVFAIYKKYWRLMIAMFPLVLSVGIAVLSPAIQGSPRYAFPIVYAMPFILAYYIYLMGTETKDRN